LLGGGKLECLVTCPLHQSYSFYPSETTRFEEICAAHHMIRRLSEHNGSQRKIYVLKVCFKLSKAATETYTMSKLLSQSGNCQQTEPHLIGFPSSEVK
jgi:hypothetical protein